MTNGLALAVGVAVLLVLNSLAQGYRQAARAPLAEIGADITVQRAGEVPQELAGAVFPCSATTLKGGEVARIRSLPGVRKVGQALLLWVFDPDQAAVVLGIEETGTTGPAILQRHVTEGRPLAGHGPEALVETAFARQSGIRVGGTVRLSGRVYPVAGLVDASRAPKIATANIYLPLAEARSLAVASPQLQSVSPFAAEDVNLLFLLADQEQTPRLSAAIREILGKKASIATPESFLTSLGSLFALSDQLARAASLVAVIVAVLVTVKTMAGNAVERTSEIGVLKAVGWTTREVTAQLTAEAVCQCLAAGLMGLLVALAATHVLGLLTVNIPVPWELAPTPHFLPGGGDPVFRTLRLPVRISWPLALLAVLLSVAAGGLTGSTLLRRIGRIRPSEALRHE
ncbi:MAG: ABC transporter permease [Thermodesulfobacteriota bacterium]